LFSAVSGILPVHAASQSTQRFDDQEIAKRICEAMDDTRSTYNTGEANFGFLYEENRGCQNEGPQNKEWDTFGFWAVATWIQEGHQYQENINELTTVFTYKDSVYSRQVTVGTHQGMYMISSDGAKLYTMLYWGDSSLFATFGAEKNINLSSLSEEKKNTLFKKMQDDALRYAQTLETSLVQHDAYDVLVSEKPEKLPIIFLPGVAGSWLFATRGSSSDQTWPVGGTDTRYMFLQDDGIKPSDSTVTIKATDILRSGGPLNFYGGMIDYLTSKGYELDQDLFLFPYDWRLDNAKHVSDLDKLVDSVKAKTGAEKVILIAHSMGGIISKAYVNNEGKNKVDSLITIGTPFFGAVKPYYALVNGYNFANPFVTQLSMKIMAQNAPAVYQLLPQVPFIHDMELLRDLTLEESQKIKYKEVKEGRLSYYETENNNWFFNDKLVKKSNEFHEKIGPKSNPTPLQDGVKHYVIIGYGVSTLSEYLVYDVPKEQQHLELLGRSVRLVPNFDDGDGTVPIWSSQISKVTSTYYIHHTDDASAEHGKLTDNPEVQKIVDSILDKKPLSTNSYTPSDGLSKTDYTSFSLQSDAHLTILDQTGSGRLGINEKGEIQETIPTGTFLAIDGAEYASVTNLDTKYKVQVNGIQPGQFLLGIDIAKDGIKSSFSYPEVSVKQGDIAEFEFVPAAISDTLPDLKIKSGQSVANLAAELKGTEKILPTKFEVKSNSGVKDNGDNQNNDTVVPQKGGCLIATAAFGTELSPQIQLLRETRDNILLDTKSGTTFMNGFNQFYYSFSPTVADWERENPMFKEFVKLAITPMISSLSILNYADMDSEASVLGYGISLILLNVGMYFVAPAIVIVGIRKKFKSCLVF
jgi:pimeloyl-ACP methyl ester carboxylesterase